MVNQEYLNKIFEYNKETGVLIWKVTRSSKVKCGMIAGSLNPHNGGYIQVIFNKRAYYAHKIIWEMIYGERPKYLDHIDGNRANNRLNNLRSVNASQNACNSRVSKRNTTGYKGVHWNKQRNKWTVFVRKNRKLHYGGAYINLIDAIQCAIQLRIKLHGEYCNHAL